MNSTLGKAMLNLPPLTDHTRRERDAIERERLRLNPVVDAVLAHKPKPKSSPARKRARRAKKIAQAAP